MVLVKLLHILALLLGIGVSVANLLISVLAEKGAFADERPLAMRPKFSRFGLAAVVLIWITGVWLYMDRWNGAELGPVFTLKLAAAALLLLAIVSINVAGGWSARTSRPMPVAIQKLGPLTLVLTLIAAITAVWVFD
ncbi:MAG: hypothetical protein AB3N20_08100 [Rhizobiaceae bacterium]